MVTERDMVMELGRDSNNKKENFMKTLLLTYKTHHEINLITEFGTLLRSEDSYSSSGRGSGRGSGWGDGDGIASDNNYTSGYGYGYGVGYGFGFGSGDGSGDGYGSCFIFDNSK